MTEGVLNIYKEKNMTSFDVVAKLRRILKIRKIGHTGTLDPDATGVLPVCIGSATKLVELLENTDKTYRAVMLLGKKTDTQDISGEVLEEANQAQVLDALAQFCKVELGAAKSIDQDVLQSAFLSLMESFTGQISQVPPMYSALKVNGVKLVDAARRGQVIERKARLVTIYEFRNLKVLPDLQQICFEVRCSKGTYIRTLCEDIGVAIGLPACLASLERIEASGLSVKDAITLEEVSRFAEQGSISEKILPVDVFLQSYEALTVTEAGLSKVLVGNFLYPQDVEENGFEDAAYRIYDANGRFYALYRYDEDKKCLRPQKMFLPQNEN